MRAKNRIRRGWHLAGFKKTLLAGHKRKRQLGETFFADVTPNASRFSLAPSALAITRLDTVLGLAQKHAFVRAPRCTKTLSAEHFLPKKLVRRNNSSDKVGQNATKPLARTFEAQDNQS